MYTNLLQRAFSIVGGARQSLLSVRNPSESESIFFMIDCSRLCCSSWPSLTYSSTSSFGEGNHTQENQVLQSVGYNSGGKKGYHMPHWHQRFQDDPHFLSSIRSPYHLKRSCPLSFSNSPGAATVPPALQASGAPRAQAALRPAPIVRPPQPRPRLSAQLCPWTKPVAVRNPAWHPHLDAQQRLTVVVSPVLALRVMQLLRLAGAGHRGVQQQQPQRRGPWAQPHRACPARTRKNGGNEAGGARA